MLTVGSGTLTIKDGKYQVLNLIDAAGTASTLRVGATIYDSSAAAKVTLASGVEFADASSRTTAIKITGNALNNTILGGTGKDTLYGLDGADSLLGGKGNDYLRGYDGDDTLIGGEGNDSLKGNGGDDLLMGGAGNDSLWGEDGKDTFIYNNGDGKDIIYGFDSDDMLQIVGTFEISFNMGFSSNTVSFKVGSTADAITLKDFTTTTFNVNGSTYAISGSQIVKK